MATILTPQILQNGGRIPTDGLALTGGLPQGFQGGQPQVQGFPQQQAQQAQLQQLPPQAQQAQQQPLPQFGLAGAENALLLGAGVGRQDLAPFAQTGVSANQQQAALSGALGPQAQQQALQGFQESPGQAFLRERGERALTRNAAAVGGLGGGNVLRELQEQGIGFAAQNLAQQQQQLGQVANRGFGAAQQGANIATGTGQQVGQARFQAGRDIAQATAGTASALSGLANQQGAGISDITGQTAGGIAGLIERAGQGSANDIQQLQMLLANISAGTGSQVAGLPQFAAIQPPSALGQLGQIAGGVGGLVSAFGQGS